MTSADVVDTNRAPTIWAGLMVVEAVVEMGVDLKLTSIRLSYSKSERGHDASRSSPLELRR
jgi:hypothetical protein